MTTQPVVEPEKVPATVNVVESTVTVCGAITDRGEVVVSYTVTSRLAVWYPCVEAGIVKDVPVNAVHAGAVPPPLPPPPQSPGAHAVPFQHIG